jgi:hypothetical protein
MATVHTIKIEVSGSAGSYTAVLKNHPKKVKPLEAIMWKVTTEPGDVPASTVACVKFFTKSGSVKTPANGCFQGRPRIDGMRITRKNGTTVHVIPAGFIDTNVAVGTTTSFFYEVVYKDASGADLAPALIDPEIIVEGGTDEPLVKPKKKKKKKKKKKNKKKTTKSKNATRARKASKR